MYIATDLLWSLRNLSCSYMCMVRPHKNKVDDRDVPVLGKEHEQKVKADLWCMVSA